MLFTCQLAHGNLKGQISDFTNLKELYQKIADCFNIHVSEIMFCTRNTHSIDMNNLAEGFVEQSDLIFAHIKGKTKQVTITKSEDTLGMTVIDNAAGYVFIKRIKEKSLISRHPSIKVGDFIEQINTQILTGMGQEKASTVLKDIPKGSTFVMYLVEPKQTSPSATSSDQSYSKAQVHLPSVDLTADRPCNACQINDITNPAVVYCQPCREFYCPACKDCHRAFKLTRDHVLVTLSPKTKLIHDSDVQEEESISGL